MLAAAPTSGQMHTGWDILGSTHATLVHPCTWSLNGCACDWCRQMSSSSSSACVLCRCAPHIPRCRRVPLPHHDHGRFSFPAPLEITSLQVNVPVYQLPELPPPDRPPVQPRAPDLAVPLLVSSWLCLSLLLLHLPLVKLQQVTECIYQACGIFDKHCCCYLNSRQAEQPATNAQLDTSSMW